MDNIQQEQFLKKALEKYIADTLQGFASWYTLKIDIYITNCPTSQDTRVEVCILWSKQFHFKSTRRRALKDLIENLDQDLNISKKDLLDMNYGEVKTDKANLYDSNKVQWCNSYLNYHIPKALYNELEAWAIIANCELNTIKFE